MSDPLQPVATIDARASVFTLINTFHVKPGAQDALVAELTAITESTMQYLPGFIGASVHRSLDGAHVVNYVQWQTEAHFAAMFENAAAKAHMDRVSQHARSITPVFYAVAYVGARG